MAAFPEKSLGFRQFDEGSIVSSDSFIFEDVAVDLNFHCFRQLPQTGKTAKIAAKNSKFLLSGTYRDVGTNP